jgi:hypothetical protein
MPDEQESQPPQQPEPAPQTGIPGQHPDQEYTDRRGLDPSRWTPK